MEEKNTIFTPADILMPDCAPADPAWQSWAVIACDQFTSEPEYWQEAESLAAGKPSTLELILPEAYLGTDAAQQKNEIIAKNMKTVCSRLRTLEDSIVYLERTLPDGGVRRGIIGKIDLEEYDYSPASTSAVRATEQTVLDRIPPRVAVRRSATVELPHVMLLADDPENKLILPLAEKTAELIPLYDFPLMLGGGHARGYQVTGSALDALLTAIRAYENARQGGVVYAVGDGNHSLASAAAFYSELKAQLGNAAKTHPARYALVEIVNLHDSSLAFEPIYRLVKNCDPAALLADMEKSAANAPEGQLTALYGQQEASVSLPGGHSLDVGCLQLFLDAYVEAHPGTVCDYIHGENSLRTLSRAEGCVGFLCSGVGKDSLFSYVAENGALPRKTFSMGEAKSKRYYLEARKIVR